MNTKIKMMLLGTLLALSTTVLAFDFQSGDKITCFDDVSGYTYTVKIQDIGDEEAYVRVRTDRGNYFYPATRVIFSQSELGITIEMLNADNTEVEEDLIIPYFSSNDELVYGDYSDRGDSRPVDCRLK